MNQALQAIGRATVEARLVDWAREYGGGRYEAIGWSTGPHILAKLIEFGGFMPGSGAPRGTIAMTAADEVDRVVKRLAQSWPAHAAVIRSDYFSPGMAMGSRLEFLRLQGHKMGKSSYYQFLESAKLYVAGAL